MPQHFQSPLQSLAAWAFSAMLLFALLLNGCTSLNGTDRSILTEHGVSDPLRSKMAHLTPLTLPEIAELSQRGLLPEYITQYLRATHQVYHLTDRDGFWLNRHGVNSTVITYLYASPNVLDRPSDRMAILDWAPYFTPFFSGSYNTFGHDYYLPGNAKLAASQTKAEAVIEK